MPAGHLLVCLPGTLKAGESAWRVELRQHLRKRYGDAQDTLEGFRGATCGATEVVFEPADVLLRERDAVGTAAVAVRTDDRPDTPAELRLRESL